VTGVFGKLPAHGDFVRRGLPQSFVGPWDAWLQAGIGVARGALGEAFEPSWAATPAWRFFLPAGACGPAAVAGLLLPSADAVGRPFPLTLAKLLAEGETPPGPVWFDAVERAALAARDRGELVDVLVATLPPVMPLPPGALLGLGWWTREGRAWRLPALPAAAQFARLLQPAEVASRPQVQAATHRGTVRQRNEDAYVERADIGLWAVADGAGGHGAGDVASQAAMQALAALPTGLSAGQALSLVRLRLSEVHADMQQRAAASTEGVIPATTVVVLLAHDDHFACLWAGDSRAYLLREGVLCQLTTDHSLVQELVTAGALRAEDAEGHPQANVITRAVGAPDALVLDKVAGRLQTGDRVLLCTDGLFKALPESRIEQVLAGGGGAEELIALSLQAGARDNVTALVVGV
jgi:protein phosphatase/serine/threonine-protein phosphatase Stp1